MSDAIIEIRNLSKRYGKTVAVEPSNLTIHRGEFFALLGPSGCGKSTILRMIAGFEVPSDGEVVIDGVSMAGIEPNNRPVNMVFQSYAVFPHMSVIDNVSYGLKVTGVPKAEIRERASTALEQVHLGDFAQRMPDQLSGGQRQRVALARALVKQPKVLLLDEPLSALDAKLREAMQIELRRLQKETGITFVVVTHDQHEALSMADRCAVMDKGYIAQLGTPQQLYEQPAKRFVADFIGKINLLPVEIKAATDDTIVLSSALGEIELPKSALQDGQSAPSAGGHATLAIRPEKVSVHRDEPPADQLHFRATIGTSAYYGSYNLLIVETAEGVRFTVEHNNVDRLFEQWQAGESCWLALHPEDALLLTD
ncbi:ABC transporter ATP-binding protein [Gammaproteobacteria bacterium]|nr:ABC transporter ATP-binding protein [Gammaproteobacteria bacterium]